MKNEVTSKRVAAIAGRILEKLGDAKPVGVYVWSTRKNPPHHFAICSVRELKALAASALTQSPDKPKKKAKR